MEARKIEFKPLTLLVGVSGVGKTRILKALLELQKIAQGRSLVGVKWDIEFRTSEGKECAWSGEFENKGGIPKKLFNISDNDDDEKDKPSLVQEKLIINGNLVVNRHGEDIVFNNNEIAIKLSQKISVISLLKDEQIKEICEDFKKIIFDDNRDSGFGSVNFIFDFDGEMESKLEKYNTLEAIRNSDEDIKVKLFLLHENQKESFRDVIDSFMEIFPYVENIKLETISNSHKIPDLLRHVPFIQIKEKNVVHWIEEFKMSSGMLRTLMQLAELHLCADNSVILIDEFENSLGINCIDDLTSSIVSSERNLQFIVTSHHPYIINNIDYANWKLVTRNGGIVKAQDATEFGIGRSKHETFTQLINLDAYAEGIAS